MRKSLAMATAVGVVAVGLALFIGTLWGVRPTRSDAVPATVVMLSAIGSWWRTVRRAGKP